MNIELRKLTKDNTKESDKHCPNCNALLRIHREKIYMRGLGEVHLDKTINYAKPTLICIECGWPANEN